MLLFRVLLFKADVAAASVAGVLTNKEKRGC